MALQHPPTPEAELGYRRCAGNGAASPLAKSASEGTTAAGLRCNFCASRTSRGGTLVISTSCAK
eukprot:4731051-Alexandrium_andersonii.AAC.1